jgi:hypothetical protein
MTKTLLRDAGIDAETLINLRDDPEGMADYLRSVHINDVHEAIADLVEIGLVELAGFTEVGEPIWKAT